MQCVVSLVLIECAGMVKNFEYSLISGLILKVKARLPNKSNMKKHSTLASLCALAKFHQSFKSFCRMVGDIFCSFHKTPQRLLIAVLFPDPHYESSIFGSGLLTHWMVSKCPHNHKGWMGLRVLNLMRQQFIGIMLCRHRSSKWWKKGTALFLRAKALQEQNESCQILAKSATARTTKKNRGSSCLHCRMAIELNPWMVVNICSSVQDMAPVH